MSHTRITTSDRPNYVTFPGALMPYPHRGFQSPQLMQDKFGNNIVRDCYEMQGIAQQLNALWKKIPDEDDKLQEERKLYFANEIIMSLNSLCEAMDSYLLSEDTDELQKKLMRFKEMIDLLNDKLQALKVAEAHIQPIKGASIMILTGFFSGSLLSGFGAFCGAGVGGLLSGRGCDMGRNASTVRQEIWLQRGVDTGENIIVAIEAHLPKREEHQGAAVFPAGLFG